MSSVDEFRQRGRKTITLPSGLTVVIRPSFQWDLLTEFGLVVPQPARPDGRRNRRSRMRRAWRTSAPSMTKPSSVPVSIRRFRAVARWNTRNSSVWKISRMTTMSRWGRRSCSTPG